MINKPEELADHYPFNIPALRNMEELEFHPDCTFFIGENGSGKSTILEAIASIMNFGGQGGTANIMIDDASGISKLHEHMRPRRSHKLPRDKFFLRAESLYNVGTFLEEQAKEFGPDVFRRYGGKSLHQRSMASHS